MTPFVCILCIYLLSLSAASFRGSHSGSISSTSHGLSHPLFVPLFVFSYPPVSLLWSSSLLSQWHIHFKHFTSNIFFFSPHNMSKPSEPRLPLLLSQSLVLLPAFWKLPLSLAHTVNLVLQLSCILFLLL